MDVRCTQCSANVTVPSDARLIQCGFCEAALVVDAGAVTFNEVIRPTVAPDQVASHLRRFLAGDATVSGLDREARIGAPRLEFFPFWAFTVGKGPAGRTTLEPAAPSSLQGLQGLTLPPGETLPRTSAVTGQTPVLEPEVPMATAREWFASRRGAESIERSVLYHLPLYRVPYTWRGVTYQAAVDGVSGRVFPAAYPAKAEAPYKAVLVLALLVFGLEGCAVSSVPLKLALYALSAIPIMAAAWWVVRKS